MKTQSEDLHLYPRITPIALAISTALSAVYVNPVLAAVGDPVGVETMVNTYTTADQITPSIAMDADGDFVVSWQGEGAGDSLGIFAQRFNANGTKAGGELSVNSHTTGTQKIPSVAMDADGDFVVVWQSDFQLNAGDIYAQRYNANGSKAGGEFLVNSYTSNHQKAPSVAMDADGDFVVSWHGAGTGDANGVYAQRFNASGTKVGSEILVNTYTSGNQENSSVAMDADGDFVVSWQDAGQDGDGFGIYIQRFTAAGTPVGSEGLVNSGYTTGAQKNPSVAMDDDGDFVVVWQDGASAVDGKDGDGYGVYMQRYNASGTKAGGERLVHNTYTTGDQLNPSVAMDADGDFVVSWQGRGGGGDLSGVYAQRYNANGNKSGGAVLVNTDTGDVQASPAVAMDDDGDTVVSWESKYAIGNRNVYFQRYEGAGTGGGGSTVDLNLVVNDDVDDETTPVNTGTNFVYSLIITNNGTGTATNVTLSEPIPAGISYVSDDAASAGWNCALADSTLECNLPSMASGAMSTINVTVTALSAGTTSNVVSVTSDQTDTNTADNTDTETTVIVGATVDPPVEPTGTIPTFSGLVTDGGGGGSLSWLTGLLLLPFSLRRNRRKDA